MNSQPVTVKEQKKKYGKYEDYEIESAVRTIIEAEEIKADKEKMKYVLPLLEKKAKGMKKAITSLDDLRSARQELAENDD
jgi:hypothetical protein